jgi:hypothetical protein
MLFGSDCGCFFIFLVEVPTVRWLGLIKPNLVLKSFFSTWI